MSRDYYSEINLHLTWHTKASLPMLIAKIETEAHHYIRGRCIESPGCYVHAIGGIETHIHLCVTISPTLLISDFVGKIKGSSSHDVNQKHGHGRKVLEWQTGYGVVSFGTKDLPWVIDYVEHPRERHAVNRVEDRLERITEVETPASMPEGEPLTRQAP